jgi:putative colanic acid biosynthesis acetyltransferase WcaF
MKAGDRDSSPELGAFDDAAQPVIELRLAGKGNFQSARGLFIQILWFAIEATIINSRFMRISSIRVGLMRLFGARIGNGCRILHPIRLKYPWNLEIGDNCWIGEGVWLYNQGKICIGSNVCISQESLLTTGSHDLKKTMDLRIAPIVIEDGAWVSSRCIVQMGVTIGRSAVVTPMSVVHKSLAPEGIYGGNPCRLIKKRFN